MPLSCKRPARWAPGAIPTLDFILYHPGAVVKKVDVKSNDGDGGHMTTSTTSDGWAPRSWEPGLRYPDPSVQILDPSFAKYRLALSGVEQLATGMRWSEGPVYFGDL